MAQILLNLSLKGCRLENELVGFCTIQPRFDSHQCNGKGVHEEQTEFSQRIVPEFCYLVPKIKTIDRR